MRSRLDLRGNGRRRENAPRRRDSEAARRGKRRQGVFCDFSDLLERIQATFSKANSDSADDVLAPYRDAELLVLDELGARRPTDWVRDVLYGLINTRYNRQRITIVTSNYGDIVGPNGEEQLEKRVGNMVRSRLYEMCDLVALEGSDYRAMRAVRV